MEINGLIIDPTSKGPIIVLRDSAGTRLLPIWIGVFEANAIALSIEQIETPRPMTHDLLRQTIEHLGAAVTKIVISDLQDGTFFARIHVARNGVGESSIDARPSDAIALALRVEAPIYVAQTVLEKAKVDSQTDEMTDEERIRKVLEELNPEDMGKYTM